MRFPRQISILVIFLFSFQGVPVRAQHVVLLNMEHYDLDRFHFGFVLGVDQSFVTIRPIADLSTHMFDSTYLPDILPLPDSARLLTVQSTSAPGFVISIVSNMRIGDHFDLRFIPSLSFGDLSLNYTIQSYRKGDTTMYNVTKRVPSTYINFPLEIRYKALRYGNFRPYLLTGVQYTLDLASQAKKREKKNSEQKIVKFNANDVFVEAGVGFDFYNEWFKFGIELKMMYGLMDMLKHENNIYTDGIESLKSKIFQLSFTFE
ncbi:MAG TPA: porin family protein [Bacteroidales bacterium]|nr:porin family protein [Bacteroidales bacterium]